MPDWDYSNISFNPTYGNGWKEISNPNNDNGPIRPWKEIPNPNNKPEEEESWLHWGVGQGLRIVPSVIGGMAGATFGGATGGIAVPGVGLIPGALAGAMAGGATGGGVGEVLGEWWDDKGYNPQMIGTQTALGAIPGFWNAKLEGKGLYQLGKYALKGGVEGAGQNILGTPFTHQAERDNLFNPSEWEMPSASEFGWNAAAGLGMGTVGGAIHGKYFHPDTNVPTPEDKAILDDIYPPGLQKIANGPYKNLPLDQGLNFDPSLTGGPNAESPGRGIADQAVAGAFHTANTFDNITRNIGRQVFDPGDPFQDVQDALRGADIGTRAIDSIPPKDPFQGGLQSDSMGGDPLRESPTGSMFGMEQGGDMATGGDWSKRPQRLDPRGDEAIPEMAFQPDEGKATTAEFQEGFLPENSGGIDNNLSRTDIENETKTAPERELQRITNEFPDILDDAIDIYRETTPERISQNLARRSKEAEGLFRQIFRMDDAHRRGGPPVPQELRDAHHRATALFRLAQDKYERASYHLVRGESPRFAPDFNQSDSGMGGQDLLRESTQNPLFEDPRATGGNEGAPPPNDPIEQLRRQLGREPTPEEIAALRPPSIREQLGIPPDAPSTSIREQNQADADLREQIGAGQPVTPPSTMDSAINSVLHAFALNPNIKMAEVNQMLAHLSPRDMRRAQTIIVQMINKGATLPDPSISSPDAIMKELTGGQERMPSHNQGDPAWEETPDEANIPTTSIGGIIDQKKQALRDMSYDPSGMSGWEADMALQRVNRAREVPSGEQPLLGLEEQKPANVAPEPEQVRQKDVLKVATLMEAGMAKQAQEIRALHDMYGRPITPEEEVAALAEHYTRMGDAEKAAHYNELADRYSGIQQGQQDMFKPNSFEGGSGRPDDPNQMSQEWMDEQNGRIPPKGSLGVRPSGVLRNPPLEDTVLAPKQAEAVARQQRVDDVIRLENQARAFEKQAKAAMDTGNPELAMQHAAAAELHRKQAATAHMQFAKEMKGKMKDVERFQSMSRAREAAGDTEGAARLKAQAETEILREAGQMELRFRKNYLAQKMEEMGFTLSEKTIHDIDNMDPDLLSHHLQKDFAELLLSSEHGGKPGLDVRDVPSDRPSLTETHITIRDKNGRAIAHAEMQTNKFTGEGDLVNWAVNQESGMAQRAVLPLAMELEKRGGLVPKGAYSQDTKNFLQTLRDLMKNVMKDDTGAMPIGPGGGGGQTPPTPPPTATGGTPPAGGGGGGRRPRQPRANAGGTWWDWLKDRAGWNQGYKTNKRQRAIARQQIQWIDEALAMPNNMTTTGDLSGPGRQGLMLFHTPEFWNAFIAMFKGITPAGFDHIDKQLKNMRIMQSPGNDPVTGKPIPSMAQKWGMKMFAPASTPGPHAKGAASNWLETGRFFNKDIPYITKGWAKSPLAMIIRGSNRAFITFLNHLNVNRLQYLAERAQDNSGKAHRTGQVRKPGLLGGFNPSEFRFGIGKMMPDVDIGFHDSIDYSTASQAEIKAWGKYADSLDPYNNKALGKELADAVNTLTGHAPLRTHILPFRGAELNLEKHARLMGRLFFAPGLMMSRIRAMNPSTYVMATPSVRKEMVKGLFGATAGYTAAALLLKNGAKALGYDSEINLDSNSADFGKIRVGNYRMDPSGGMLPYLVLYSRLISGYYTSSSTGRTTELGRGFQATTAGTLTDRFLSNKQEPIAKFVTDMLSASEHQPVYMKDRLAQMMTPMLAQDIYELSNEDPGLIPLSVGSFFGAGSQVYKQGQAGTKFTDPANEKVYAGGGLRGLFFGADFQNEQKGTGVRQLAPRQTNPRKLKPRQLKPRPF